MPFETPPGQLLSSIPPTADKRRGSKLGGCAGVLLQIFHGKRWLPRKSLPAERLKQATSNHTDDKLPIAKLLLIADENRIGSLRNGDAVIEGEIVEKIDLDEEKGPRRTPGVVARLMGLESMPSRRVAFVESNLEEPCKNADDQIVAEACQKRDSTPAVVLPQHSSLQKTKLREFKTGLPSKFAVCQRKKVQDGSARPEALVNIVSSSRHHEDTSFPSSVKGDASKRKSMGTQKPANRIEVAPKLLKGNQRHHQGESQRLQSPSFGTKSSSLRGKGQLTSSTAGPQCIKRDVLPHPAIVERSQNGDMQKVEMAQHHTAKRSSQEGTFLKRKPTHQRTMEQLKAVPNEKSRNDLRRHDVFSSRLSQPTVCSLKKSQGVRTLRHPSASKSSQDSTGGAHSSQASNCITSSSEGSLPSQSIESDIGSTNITPEIRYDSSSRESLGQPEQVEDFADIRKPMVVHHTVAQLALRDMTLIDSLDVSHSVNSGNSFYSSQFDHDGSTSSAIYTESLQRSSLESSISSDPSLSDFTSTSEECSNFSVVESVAGHEKGEKKQKEDDLKTLHGVNRVAEFSQMECSDSLSESLMSSLSGETAPLHGETDIISESADLGHTYSGKNTAAILQELLTALSSSAGQKKFSFDNELDGTVPCLMDSETVKPHISSNVYAPCSDNSCAELTCQDSTFLTSSDGSQLSQGIEECKVENLDDDRVTVRELQPETGSRSPVSGTGRTSLQNELSRDCEALMSTISKLHQIDPDVIGLRARTVNDHTMGHVSDKPVEQNEQPSRSLFSSASFTSEGDADSSTCKSEIESDFRTGSDEIAVWNKKLISDCIDEAFKSLSKQVYKFSSSVSQPPTTTHLLSRVYMQLDEWRGMAASMNLDDMIEKEMNVAARNWRHCGNETEDVAAVVQSTIFSGLLEEMLLELM